MQQSTMLVPLCLWYALMDFLQTFVIRASWHKDDLIWFGGLKVKDQGPCVTKGIQSSLLCIEF